MIKHSDLTFITNEKDQNLLERFKVLIKDTEFFDVLVGYFYTTGFHALYKSLENTKRVRILIGISTNKETMDLIEQAKQSEFPFSHAEAKEHFSKKLIQEMDTSEDNLQIQEGVIKFIEWLRNGKLEIKVYPSENIHAKLVIANPPYAGFRDLENNIKKLLTKLYISAKGRFDLYIPFIEKSYYILKDKGFFIFICPTAFAKREYGRALKEFLLPNVTLNELIDFEHSQIFEKAKNYTGIFSFRKGAHKESTFIYRRGFKGRPVIKKQSEISSNLWIFLDL